MEKIKQTILDNKLIKSGEVIGVGVSGGKDSMALLHYLNGLSKKMDFEIVALTIDHGIRETSPLDVLHVMNFCKKNGIRAYKFKTNAVLISKQKKLSIEAAAREARYAIFNSMLEKGVVDKVAIAHTSNDQAETILMNIFRGCGIKGVAGMDYIKDNIFIRPMLDVSTADVWKYINEYDIEIREDETNKENNYARNYLRNSIMARVYKKWPNAMENINNFAKLAKKDEAYINSQLPLDSLIVMDKQVKIPLSCFLYKQSIKTRLVYSALEQIGIKKDIEQKHINLILELVENGENGKKINLPNLLVAYKEYDFLTLTNVFVPKINLYANHETGIISVGNIAKLVIRNTKIVEKKDDTLYIDSAKLPDGCVWRFREDGDVFEKFGGGTKKLKSFLINKKIPKKDRDLIPVLAKDNKVFVVAGVEISDAVKITEKTRKIQKISLKNV